MNPILVNVMRKNIVESFHRGSAIVVNSDGQTVFSVGNIERLIYPRSSLKFFQAIPLIESGAADAYRLGDSEISLACASHSGEERHIKAVCSWLDKIGLNADDLENGATDPLSEQATRKLVAEGQSPSRKHQTCSGKHTGMLTHARHIGVDTHGYSDFDHPTQMAWMNALSELVGIDVRTLDWEWDGCGLPAICMPICKLALGCALFADTGKVGGVRGQAMQRIIKAIQAEPLMLAGTDRCCTEVIVNTRGQAIVKTGAEGVYSGFLPGKKLGFALKIDDGSTRASEVALGALLNCIEALDVNAGRALEKYFCPEISNSQGKVTGNIVPSDSWGLSVQSAL